MMQALQPWNLRVISRTGAMPGATGDGIKACIWVGAKMDETHSAMKFDRTALHIGQKPGLETVKAGTSKMFWMGSQPWLKVTSEGVRFMNETGGYWGSEENLGAPAEAGLGGVRRPGARRG